MEPPPAVEKKMEPLPDFYVSGPVHLLTCFDWTNSYHRRSVAASLVQGVYGLERNRGGTKQEYDNHVTPWWTRFGFQLNYVLKESNSSYFGAIYELKQAPPRHFHHSSPKYVIAFRGTRLDDFQDWKLNLKSVVYKQEETPRFHNAINAVRDMVNDAGAAKVWIAGHSLGASIALYAGRNMAKGRVYLETYLFNPPCITFPTEMWIEKWKHRVRIAGSFIKAGVATMLRIEGNDPENDMFSVLSEWTPYMFVNGEDLISAEYIGYFQHREKMEEMGVGEIEKIATKYSVVSLVSGAVGIHLEPMRIIPTVYLTENLSPTEGFRQAHGVDQWWQPHSQWKSKLYKFEAL